MFWRFLYTVAYKILNFAWMEIAQTENELSIMNICKILWMILAVKRCNSNFLQKKIIIQYVPVNVFKPLKFILIEFHQNYPISPKKASFKEFYCKPSNSYATVCNSYTSSVLIWHLLKGKIITLDKDGRGGGVSMEFVETLKTQSNYWRHKEIMKTPMYQLKKCL